MAKCVDKTCRLRVNCARYLLIGGPVDSIFSHSPRRSDQSCDEYMPATEWDDRSLHTVAQADARATLFAATAAKQGRGPYYIEKDEQDGE